MSSLPGPSRHESLAQQGYRTIRRAIRDGRIVRGQFFSETTLAQSLGVSRTPVREALLNLYRDGVVDIVPKRGYRLVELDEESIREIRLLRVALEQIVVGRLCEIVTDENIAELRAILAGAGGDPEDIYAVDEAFHVRMAEMAGLKQICREIMSVRGKMFLMASGTQVAAMRSDRAVREHTDVVDALARRDGEAAKRFMAEHVERSVDAFVAARTALVGHRPLDRLS